MACADLAVDTSLQIVPVTDEEYLTPLADPWNALAGDVPFRTFEWAQSWWRHYQDRGNRLFTLVAIDEHGDLVGIAPWYVASSPRLGKVVRFLGSGEVCSDYVTILTHPHRAGAVAERMADWLATEGARSMEPARSRRRRTVRSDDQLPGPSAGGAWSPRRAPERTELLAGDAGRDLGRLSGRAVENAQVANANVAEAHVRGRDAPLSTQSPTMPSSSRRSTR